MDLIGFERCTDRHSHAQETESRGRCRGRGEGAGPQEEEEAEPQIQEEKHEEQSSEVHDDEFLQEIVIDVASAATCRSFPTSALEQPKQSMYLGGS